MNELQEANARLLIAGLDAQEQVHAQTVLNAALRELLESREQAEAALRESENRYRRLFTSMDEGFCVIERVEAEAGEPLDFRYLEANPAFLANSGVGDVVGKTIRQAFPGEPEEWFETYDTVLRTGEPIRFTRRLATQGRVLELYAFRVDDSTRRRVAVLFKDVTERERHLAGEQQAREQAEGALRVRDEFLAIASHELRTPLAAVKGTAQLALRALQRGVLDEARTERHFRGIRESADRLEQLLADLLDVARMRSGGPTVRREPMDLAALVLAVAERYEDRLDDHHRLSTRLPDRPILVDGDAGRLEQVLDNMLSNAFKYSPDGGQVNIRLGEVARKPPDDGDGVVLTVSDAGIGLPTGELERIFEPFGRATNATRRSLPGMGLGLHISRQIVVAHGGRMWAESAGEDQGTTLCVWLPIGTAASISDAGPSDPGGA